MSSRANVLQKHAVRWTYTRPSVSQRFAHLRPLPISRSRLSNASSRFSSTSADNASKSASEATAEAASKGEAAKETAKETVKESAKESAAKTTAGAAGAASGARSFSRRLRNLFLGTTFVIVGGIGYLYATDTRASIHQYVVPPLIRTLFPDAEKAHHITIAALDTLNRFGLHPRERGDPDAAGDLTVTVYGHTLDNPIGISAGLDKNAMVPDALFALGPAIVEVGGITPQPQEGNPKPRVFRVPSQNAIINRYGLNSEGADTVAQRLRQRVREFAYQWGFGMGPDAEKLVLDGQAGVPPGSLVPGKILCVQVAKNKTTPDGDIEAVKNDYVYCVDRLAKYADVIVVNVSSPNTPGLRTLQRVEPLTRILSGVVDSAKSADRKTKPAVMVKVSPDEDSDQQMSGICDAVWESGVDGVIVGNTTNKRPDPLPRGFILPAKEQDTMLETGGYSGPQMFDRTLSLVGRYRKMLDKGPRLPTEEAKEPAQAETANDASRGQLSLPDASDPLSSNSDDLAESAPVVKAAAPPSTVVVRSPFSHEPKEIWATGGVSNGEQALQLLNAGASVAMIYTSMAYNGSGTVTKIKQQMREEMHKK
ncbi:putative dihydroorotate reductase pyre [Phyllosticta citrichinensis]|uniref:Dihydroorotate dehydrogenase (quinone), mitochondrial n=1 Tax=Phyllosticta citrichinensis TaxID=1130410 RepID=A0ABR1XGY7_9PEZI